MIRVFCHALCLLATASCLKAAESVLWPDAGNSQSLVLGEEQVDTFDYKPLLAKHAGERPEIVNRKSLRSTDGPHAISVNFFSLTTHASLSTS
jgi:hypothetical protein